MFSLRRSVFRSLKPGSVYVPPAVLQQQRARAFQTVAVLSSSNSGLTIERSQESRLWKGFESQRRFQSNEGAPTWARDSPERPEQDQYSNPSMHKGVDGQPLQPSKTVYVGNLSYGIRADDISREFKEFGEVVSAKIIYDPRGLSKGFGYIEFTNLEAAGAAIAKMHGLTVDGRRISVQYVAKPDRGSTGQNSPSRTLFIGNLSFDITDKDLNDLFTNIRNCTDVRVAIDRRTGQPRGFAHADFTDIDSAQTAKDVLEGKELFGRRLKLDFSQGVNNGRGGQRSFMKN